MWRKSFGKNTTSISKYKGIEHGEIEIEDGSTGIIEKKILELEKEIIDTVEKMEH